MRLSSWNVAGYRSICKKGFEESFKLLQCDILCLQEVKCEEDEIPYIPQGYQMYLNPAEKKGYAGTLVFSRVKPIQVTYDMGISEHDHEGRLITLEYEEFYLVNAYVPNSKRELVRLDYRMCWEKDMLNYLKELEKNKPVILCGDLNVAHQEIDIKNAASNKRSAGFTIEERNKFTELLENGFIDTFRYLHPNEVKYSWWSYLFHAREKNSGWRLDYFVVSSSLIERVLESDIRTEIMGSDHAPIILELK